VSALLGLALLLAPQEGEDPTAPGPRVGIEGIAGFMATSEVVFAGAPDQPHRLEFVYLFPDRARWLLAAEDAAARVLYYRFGERSWRVDAAGKASVEVEEDELDTTLLQMELRRAVLHFPAGLAWEEREDGSRRAPVRARSKAKARPIGHLEARLDGEGALASISVHDGGGELVESLTVTAWRTTRGRAWPGELVLANQDGVVWHETLGEVETRVHLVDDFFRPADRRRLRGTHVVDGRVVRALDLPAVTYRRYPLEEGAEWSAALAASRAHIAAAGRELVGTNLGLDPVPAFELDDEARPVACLVRLQTAAPPPEGWSRRSDRPGLGMLLGELGDLDRRALGLLGRLRDGGSMSGPAYCRVLRAEGPDGVQLYLPLGARE
jgi:hypothetical protein